MQDGTKSQNIVVENNPKENIKKIKKLLLVEKIKTYKFKRKTYIYIYDRNLFTGIYQNDWLHLGAFRRLLRPSSSLGA